MSETHVEAVRTVVEALRDLGRLENVDEALVTAWGRLAGELDDPETKDRAGLYREFRAYDAAVRGLGGETTDDSLANLLQSISGPAVVDPPKARKGKSGR